MVEKLLRNVLPAGSLLYLVGIFVVNLRLSTLGFASFELINSKYVIAGLYLVISVGAIFFSTWYLYGEVGFISILSKKEKRGVVIIHIWMLMFTVIFVSIAVYYFTNIQSFVVHGPFAVPLQFVSNFYDLRKLLLNHVTLPPDIRNALAGLTTLTFEVSQILAIFIAYEVVTVIRNFLTKKALLWRKLINDGVVISVYLTLLVALILTGFKNGLITVQYLNSGSPVLSVEVIYAWALSSILILYMGFSMAFNEDKREKSLKTYFKFMLTKGEGLTAFIFRGLLPLGYIVFMFILVIYTRIPFAYGGGATREVKSPILLTSGGKITGTHLYLVNETNDQYFLVVQGVSTSRLQIDKSKVDYLEFE